MAEETQIIREAPEIEAYKLGLLQRAKAESEKDITLPAYQAAGLSELQKKAIDLGQQGIGVYAPFLQQGATAIGQGMQLTQQGAQAIDPNAISTYMNPYQQQVTQNALAEMRRQADIARQQQAAGAIRAGAFGGTREGVQRAETERGIQDIMSQKIMQDLAANYAQASQRQLEQGKSLGALGASLGTLGIQQAGMGQTYSDLAARDVAQLGQLGTLQAQASQAELDAQRATQLQQALSPYQRLGFLSDIYKGAPTTQMSLTAATSPTTSPLLQAVGLGISGLSAAAGASKAGLFG
jgi:hypothetical protein